MKVTVKEKTENEIDFSVAGQLLSLIQDNNKPMVVVTNGKYSKNCFEATLLIDYDKTSEKLIGEFSNGFIKSNFKKFNGTITIEQ